MNQWERHRFYERIRTAVTYTAGAVLWILAVAALIKYLGGL